MFKALHKFYSNLTGSNTKYTPVSAIQDQLLERRPLPIGREEWVAFVERIHSGICIPGVTMDSVAFALADQILHLGPTEDFKEDAFFIHAIRKFAVNQTAVDMRKEIHEAAKKRLAEEEASKPAADSTGQVVQLTKSEVTPKPEGVTDDKEDSSA
jgi:hypothetical protein